MSESSRNPQETTPLMLSEDEAILEAQIPINLIPSKHSHLPKTQLGILCLLRTLDPMSFGQIFPYINHFIQDLQITDDPAKVGFYSGLVESSFAFTQLVSTYPWAVFSDRFGRRPVVLASVAGLSITTLLFGFSKSLTSAIVMRGAAGLFAGNGSVLPSILCEITDKTNQAFAFSFFGFWWPLGAIVGSLVGGLLSQPATRYPRHFEYDLFKEYPYFLPCFIVSCIAASGFVLSWFFLQETLHAGCAEVRKGSTFSYGATGTSETTALPKTYTLKELISVPIIRALCISAFTLSMMSNSFDVLFVLFCFSPIDLGGLSFSTSQIGLALSVSAGIAAFLQIFFMPTILRRVRPISMYHFCMKIWPYSFLSMPLLNVIARRGKVLGTEKLDTFTTICLWISIVLVLIMARVAFLAYTVNVLLVKQFTPNPSSLGSMLGLIQFSICLSRAFSPTFASSIFAFSLRHQIFGGYIWAAFMALMGLTSCLFSRNIIRESSELM